MENYRQILSTVKTQTWPMYRKIKVSVCVWIEFVGKVLFCSSPLRYRNNWFCISTFRFSKALRKAKLYIKRHEGEMKQSKQAKDIVATFRTYVNKVGAVRKIFFPSPIPVHPKKKNISDQMCSVLCVYLFRVTFPYLDFDYTCFFLFLFCGGREKWERTRVTRWPLFPWTRTRFNLFLCGNGNVNVRTCSDIRSFPCLQSIKKLRREITNLIVQLTPWEMRIKKIESKSRSSLWHSWQCPTTDIYSIVVTFRPVWIGCCFLLHVPSLGVLDQHVYKYLHLCLPHGSRGNLHQYHQIIKFWTMFWTIFWTTFSSQILRGVQDPTGMRKEVESQESALTLQAIWDFEVRVVLSFRTCVSNNVLTILSNIQGYLKYSPIFYGYYSSEETTNIGMQNRHLTTITRTRIIKLKFYPCSVLLLSEHISIATIFFFFFSQVIDFRSRTFWLVSFYTFSASFASFESKCHVSFTFREF